MYFLIYYCNAHTSTPVVGRVYLSVVIVIGLVRAMVPNSPRLKYTKPSLIVGLSDDAGSNIISRFSNSHSGAVIVVLRGPINSRSVAMLASSTTLAVLPSSLCLIVAGTAGKPVL